MTGLRAAVVVIGLIVTAACSPDGTAKLRTPPLRTSLPAVSPTGATPSATPTRPTAGSRSPDVTLAYFRPGLGVVGVSPACCGEQGTGRSRLYLTTDMTHWRDVTPPRSSRGRLDGDHPIFEDASFVDARTGWVTTWEPGAATVTVFRTGDGGATWSQAAGGGHSANAGARTSFQLLSPTLAYRETLEPTGPGMDLSVTADGGSHWRRVYAGPPPRAEGEPLAGPFEMPMTFTTASRGFAAAGIPPAEPALATSSGDVFATVDGGRSWTRQHPPMPAAARRCPTSAPAATACLIGLPVFDDPAHGVLPSVVRERSAAVVGFDTTADGGASWRLADTVTVPMPRTAASSDGTPAVTAPSVSVASATTWWVLTADGALATTRETVDGGGRWSTRAPVRLPGRPAELHALDPDQAWLVVWVPTADGTARTLLHTTDGGRTWADATP